MDMEFEKLKTYLIQKFDEWLYQQRKIYLTTSRPLSKEERLKLEGYFEPRILDLVRIAIVDRISNPEFYDELREKEIPIPMDFTSAVGFTLIDCILLRKGFESISTLFHEMVHVVQADLLGVRKLVVLYLFELIKNKTQYRNILFERQAYTLANRFNRGKSTFSVREIVEEELKQKMYLGGHK
jgi:hypothetical protein